LKCSVWLECSLGDFEQIFGKGVRDSGQGLNACVAQLTFQLLLHCLEDGSRFESIDARERVALGCSQFWPSLAYH